MELCITPGATVLDSVVVVEGSAAVLETVVGLTTVAVAIRPRVVDFEAPDT